MPKKKKKTALLCWLVVIIRLPASTPSSPDAVSSRRKATIDTQVTRCGFVSNTLALSTNIGDTTAANDLGTTYLCQLPSRLKSVLFAGHLCPPSAQSEVSQWSRRFSLQVPHTAFDGFRMIDSRFEKNRSCQRKMSRRAGCQKFSLVKREPRVDFAIPDVKRWRRSSRCASESTRRSELQEDVRKSVDGHALCAKTRLSSIFIVQTEPKKTVLLLCRFQCPGGTSDLELLEQLSARSG